MTNNKMDDQEVESLDKVESKIICKESSFLTRIKNILQNDAGDIKIKTSVAIRTAIYHLMVTASEPLNKMLKLKFKEGSDKEIDFSRYSFDAVDDFIWYIHTDEFFFPDDYEECFDLLELTQLYEQKKFSEAVIKDIIHCTSENSATDVLYCCYKYNIITDDVKNIIKNEATKQLLMRHDILMEKYLHFKKLANDDNLEVETNTIKMNLLENVMQQYIDSKIIILFEDVISSDSEKYKKICNIELIKKYPQIIRILNVKCSDDIYGDVYCTKKTTLLNLITCDDYVIVQKSVDVNMIVMILL